MTFTYAEALFQHGNSQLANRLFVEAMASYAEALGLRPEHPETLANLGVACAELGRLDEALDWYDQAIRIRPHYPEAHYNRGNVLTSAKLYSEALSAYDLAIHFDPAFSQARNNRGLVLMRLGRAREATASYREAVKLRPGFPEARNNLGLALQSVGSIDEAIRCFDETLQLQPHFAAAHSNRAQAWLLKGDFSRGWPEYEWRHQLPNNRRLPRNLPVWDGSSPIGRSILLRSEQGLGDTLQFIRYGLVLKKLGARVVLESPAALHPLLESFKGVDRLIDRNTLDTGCDCQVPLLSLPRILRTDAATIPAEIPYITAHKDRIEYWRRKFPQDRFLVGICWKGSADYPDDVFRSIPLSEFAPLADVPGVQLVSLQKGPGVEQIASFTRRDSLIELGDFDRDKPFLDTAAAMFSLDLVVTADTAIGHLAGAIGRPVWIALTVAPDWRWLLDRKDSPWYPSVRLFRQPTLGNWTAVFKEIAEAIGRLRAYNP